MNQHKRHFKSEQVCELPEGAAGKIAGSSLGRYVSEIKEFHAAGWLVSEPPLQGPEFRLQPSLVTLDKSPF